MRTITPAWSTLFHHDISPSLEKSVLKPVQKLLDDLQCSAEESLWDRCTHQADTCLEVVKVTLAEIQDTEQEGMQDAQKDATRSLRNHLKDRLRNGYDAVEGLCGTGRGSVRRQKALFHNYVDDHKDAVFEEAVDALMDQLSSAADVMGERLNEALQQLAKDIKVNLAVLWEETSEDPQQAVQRLKLLLAARKILEQVNLWMAADKMRETVTTES